jgi:hypothetical protein
MDQNGGKASEAAENGGLGKAEFEPEGKTEARLLKPRHAGIGIKDSIKEHEDERLSPGHGEGGASGAAGDKPKGPSDTA